MKWIISNLKEKLVDDFYQKELKELKRKYERIIICPNDKQLPSFQDDCLLGSQDLDYTYSVVELRKMNVKYSIIGHSDKRRKYGETNQEIHEKIKRLLENDICPILCIGEEKQAENIENIIEKQIYEALLDIKTDNIMIAYEPTWAIGSGKIPDLEFINHIVDFINEKVNQYIGIEPTIIYGGSVNQDTITILEKVNRLDGYLIGSSSTKIENLKKIVEVVI